MLFSKSMDRVKDLLPAEFDDHGNPRLDADFYLGDEDDWWKLPPAIIKVEQEETEILRRRGICFNELDITASATDIDWSAPNSSAVVCRKYFEQAYLLI